MLQPIVTSWHLPPQPTSTSYASPQTWQAWLANHQGRAQANLASYPPDTGYPIVTTWYSGGVQKSVSTSWETGETTQHWIDRHFAAVSDLMDQFPPDKT